MPFYRSIDGTTTEGRRTAERLLTLKKALDKEIPKRTVGQTLLLATWNIREFGPSKFGVRTLEPLFYIAEIIDRFDLVAVQEVRDDLAVLNALLDILGSWWKVLLTDVTEGPSGNRERMAFLYDSRKISFGGLAGEIVLPPARGKTRLAIDQLARTPYLVGFRAGWLRFTICTTHIYYGKSVKADPRRVEEIRALAQFLAKRVGEAHAWAKNMIVLGDFNIFAPEDVTFAALTAAGFSIPKKLTKIPSNFGRDKHYDQIAFIAPDVQDQIELSSAGVFNLYDYVYREADADIYADQVPETVKYATWRTFQMSDHLPMWIELRTDFSERYLTYKKQSGRKRSRPKS